MFNKKKTRELNGTEAFDTLIGINTVFDGNIESEGTVRIDGKVRGDLKINGDVIIGTNAEIKGNISATNIHLSGSVEGNINSGGLLKLASTAKLFGDIYVQSFVTDEGAVFHGKCSMVDSSAVIDKSVLKKSKDYKRSSVLNSIDDSKEKEEAAG